MIVYGGKSYLHVSNELHVLDRVRYLTLEPNYKEADDKKKNLAAEAKKLNDVRKALEEQLDKLIEQKKSKSLPGLEKLIEEKRAQIKSQEKLLSEKESQITATRKIIVKIISDIKSCLLWRVPCNQSDSLILAGDTLFAGGDNEIVAYAANDGKKVWSAPVNGAAMGIAVAHGRLLVSTNKGTIHCFGAKWKNS